MRSRMLRVTSTGETFLLRINSLNSVRLRNPRSLFGELLCIQLERRDWIQRRSGPSANRQRRSRQQEFPSLPGSGSSAQRFKVAIVEQVDAEGYKREVVNGADDRGWRNILGVVGRQQGDVLLLQPRNHRRVEPGVFAARGSSPQIWPNFFPA